MGNIVNYFCKHFSCKLSLKNELLNYYGTN